MRFAQCYAALTVAAGLRPGAFSVPLRLRVSVVDLFLIDRGPGSARDPDLRSDAYQLWKVVPPLRVEVPVVPSL